MSNVPSSYWKSFKKVINLQFNRLYHIKIKLLVYFCLAGEVPVTKLAALQKVLQSDFLASVREVYEHVYETVDIQGSQVLNIIFIIFIRTDLFYNPFLIGCPCVSYS